MFGSIKYHMNEKYFQKFLNYMFASLGVQER